MKYLSLCSGIDAATVAWHSLGWTPVGFSEIEPYPSAVLNHHYPHVPNFGDMTKFHEWPDYLQPDLLVGGTPCQSFSIAGLRRGMEDDRGNLAIKYVEIAARYRPRWILWENVPGVFSSAGGSDFASFLGALTGRAIRVPGEGWRNSGAIAGIPDAYGVAWRTLDAQFSGVAQQRRRVFVVGYLGSWQRAVAALFEASGLRGDPAPRRRTRAEIARSPAQDAGGGVAGTIGRSYEKGHGRTGGANGGVARGHLIPSAETSLCLNAGGMGRQDFETETMVVELANTLTGRQNQQRAAPLTSAPYADRGAADESKLVPVPGSLIPTPIWPIPKPTPRPPVPPIPFDPVQITSPDNRSNPKPGSACQTLAAQEKTPCIAFEPRERGDDGRGYGRPPAMLEDIAPTVNATKTACVTPPAEAYAFQQRIARNGRGDMGETVHALTSEAGEDGRGDSAPCVAVTPPAKERAGVRRLTCRECERLQGFPDDYTLIPWKNRRDPGDYAETVAYLTAAGWPEDEARVLANTPDGPRYKAIGNSMAVPVMFWIGQQISMVDKIP